MSKQHIKYNTGNVDQSVYSRYSANLESNSLPQGSTESETGLQGINRMRLSSYPNGGHDFERLSQFSYDTQQIIGRRAQTIPSSETELASSDLSYFDNLLSNRYCDEFDSNQSHCRADYESFSYSDDDDGYQISGYGNVGYNDDSTQWKSTKDKPKDTKAKPILENVKIYSSKLTVKSKKSSYNDDSLDISQVPNNSNDPSYSSTLGNEETVISNPFIDEDKKSVFKEKRMKEDKRDKKLNHNRKEHKKKIKQQIEQGKNIVEQEKKPLSMDTMTFRYPVPSPTWSIDQTILHKQDTIFKQWAIIINNLCIGDLSLSNKETIKYKFFKNENVILYLEQNPSQFVAKSKTVQRYINHVYEELSEEADILAKGATKILQLQARTRKQMLSPPVFSWDVWLIQQISELNYKDIILSWYTCFLFFINSISTWVNNKAGVGAAVEKEKTFESPYAIIWGFPLVSGCLEEIIKCVPGMWFVIGKIDSWIHKDNGKYLWHKHSMKYNLNERILMHLHENKKFVPEAKIKIAKANHIPVNMNVVLDPRQRCIEMDEQSGVLSRYPLQISNDTHLLDTAFQLANGNMVYTIPNTSCYYVWKDVPLLERNINKLFLDVNENCYMYPTLPSFSVPILPPKNLPWDGCHSSNLDNRVDHKIYAPTHVLLSPVSGMVKPAPSFDNLNAAVHFRILDIERSGCDDSVTLAMVDILPQCNFKFNEDLYEEWFNSLKPIQKKRIVQVVDMLNNNKPFKKTTSVFTKADEYISTGLGVQQSEQDEEQEVKAYPRVIYNVHPYYLHKLGSFTSQLTNYLVEEVFSKEPRYFAKINGKDVSAYYVCGSQSSDLDYYVNRALKMPPGIYILVMGDDTYAIDSCKQLVYYIETDYSKFDATQSDSLRNIWHIFLEKIGCPEQAETWRQMYKEPVKYYHRGAKRKVDVKGNPETLYTGEPGTSVRNSLTNILISALAIAYEDPNYYKLAGLIVKRKTSLTMNGTFLRGVFLENEIGEKQWTRLPSFLLKFGKTFTDPVTIYPKSWTVTQKRHQFLFSQWAGYGNLSTNWFYRSIGAQINRLTKNRISNDRNIFISNPYSIFTSSINNIPDHIFDSFMMERYGISREMMESYIDTLKSIPQIPAIYADPIILKLLAGDY